MGAVMEKLRILIADDHEVVRQGVRNLLEGRPGWEVCAEAVDGRADSKKRAKQKIIVAGCMAQRFANELPNLMPEVDAFIGLDQLTQAHIYKVEPSSNPVHEMSAFPYMPGGQLL